MSKIVWHCPECGRRWPFALNHDESGREVTPECPKCGSLEVYESVCGEEQEAQECQD